MYRGKHESTTCAFRVKYIIHAEIGAKDHNKKKEVARRCGLPVDKPIILALSQLFPAKDFGFKITQAWTKSMTGSAVCRALKASLPRVTDGTIAQMVEEVNASSACFRTSRIPLSLDRKLDLIGINISSDVYNLPDCERHLNAFPAEPAIVFDPHRDALQVNDLSKVDRVTVQMKSRLKAEQDCLYFSRTYNQSSR